MVDETAPANTGLSHMRNEHSLDLRVENNFPQPPPPHQEVATGPDEVSADTHGIEAFTDGLRIPSFSSGLATLSRLFVILCLLGASAQVMGTRCTRATGHEGMNANAVLGTSANVTSRTEATDEGSTYGALPTCSSEYTSTYLTDDEEEELSDMERLLHDDELSLGQGKTLSDRQSCWTVEAVMLPSTTGTSPNPLGVNEEGKGELLGSESTHEHDGHCEGGSDCMFDEENGLTIEATTAPSRASASPESFDVNGEGKDERQHWLFKHGDRGEGRHRRFDWLFTAEEGLFIETFSALSMTGGCSKLHAFYEEGKAKLLQWLLRHGGGGGGFGLPKGPLNEGKNGKKLLNAVGCG